MAELPTIKVVSEREEGWSLINESDFDPEVHEHYSDWPDPGPLLDPPPDEDPPLDLEGMTLTQLRKLASDRDIQGRSMNKDELLAALR